MFEMNFNMAETIAFAIVLLLIGKMCIRDSTKGFVQII